MYRMHAKLWTLILAAILLVGCGGGGYDTLDAAIDGENCTVESNNQNAMLSTDEVHCADGTMISWHQSEKDRNGYQQFVTGFLDVEPDERGEWYLIYRN